MAAAARVARRGPRGPARPPAPHRRRGGVGCARARTDRPVPRCPPRRRRSSGRGRASTGSRRPSSRSSTHRSRRRRRTYAGTAASHGVCESQVARPHGAPRRRAHRGGPGRRRAAAGGRPRRSSRRGGARRPGERHRHARPHAAREPGRPRVAARPREPPAPAVDRDGRWHSRPRWLARPAGSSGSFRLDSPTLSPHVAPDGRMLAVPRADGSVRLLSCRPSRRCACCAAATSRRPSPASAPMVRAWWSAASADRCTCGTSPPVVWTAHRSRPVAASRSGSSIPQTRPGCSRWRRTACNGSVVLWDRRDPEHPVPVGQPYRFDVDRDAIPARGDQQRRFGPRRGQLGRRVDDNLRRADPDAPARASRGRPGSSCPARTRSPPPSPSRSCSGMR